MSALRDFEAKAIRLMASGVLTEEQLRSLDELESAKSYKYTGCGYYLTLAHPGLPAAPRTLCRPVVVGDCGNIHCGFVAFLGNSELVLECHTWGEVDVPSDFRELDVSVSTAQVNEVHFENVHDA